MGVVYSFIISIISSILHSNAVHNLIKHICCNAIVFSHFLNGCVANTRQFTQLTFFHISINQHLLKSLITYSHSVTSLIRKRILFVLAGFLNKYSCLPNRENSVSIALYIIIQYSCCKVNYITPFDSIFLCSHHFGLPSSY